jgi:hypothetical protein
MCWIAASISAFLEYRAMSTLHKPLKKLGFKPETGESLLFWGLLAAATWALVHPIWLSTVPPLTDWPAHAAIADVWSRYEEVEFYRQMFELRTGLVPNVLATRFVSLLYPLVEPLTGLLIFTTLILVATVGSLVAMARAFERSEWMVFLALPFLWNVSLYWGMINFVAIYPFFFGAIALARRAGKTGSWRAGLGLCAVCLGAFFAHGLGCLFTYASAGFVLLLSVERPRDLSLFAAFVPAGALWLRWREMAAGTNGMPDEGLVQTLTEFARWFGPDKSFARFIEATNDAVLAEQDTIVLVIMVGMWLLLMGVSRQPGVQPPEDGQPGGGSVFWRRLRRRLRQIVLRFWRQTRAQPLLLLVLCLGIASAILPSHIKVTNISTRVAPLFIMSCALLPRPPRGNWIAGMAVAVSIATSLWFGQFLAEKVELWERAHMAPVVELVEQIPPHSRVECIGARRLNDAVFRGRSLDHACPGYAQLQTQGFGGIGFPGTGFNAVKFRPGVSYVGLRHDGFTNFGRLQQWDYVIVRGRHRRPPSAVAELVDTAESPVKGAPSWSLYRVRRVEMPAGDAETVGGGGGRPFRWACPDGQTLSGFDGALGRDGKIVGNLRPICAEAEVRSGENTPEDRDSAVRKRGERGVWLANYENRKSRFSLKCPRDTFAVGLRGRAGKLIDRMEIICAEMQRKDGVWEQGSPRPTRAVGGEGGEPFEMKCPGGSTMQGIYGRVGYYVDRIGIYCVEFEELLGASAPDKR